MLLAIVTLFNFKDEKNKNDTPTLSKANFQLPLDAPLAVIKDD